MPEEKYEYGYSKVQKHRRRQRVEAIKKLAQGEAPKCVICGCPHAEILHIGHPDHDGTYHRRALNHSQSKNSHQLVRWVLATPIDEVLERVQLECPYCNFWHNLFREYPDEAHRPKW